MMDTKICTKCKTEKSLDEFHVSKKVVCDGRAAVCKKCKLLASKQAYKNEPHPDFANSPPPLDAKQKCIDCGEVKSLYNDFHSNKRNKSGHFYSCKECRAKYKQKYMCENAEKIAASNHEYAKTHKVEIYQRQKEYKSKNKEVLTERDRLYRIRTKGHRAKYNHEYNNNHRAEGYARAMRWRIANVQRYIDNSRIYALKNRDFINARRRRRHAEKPWVANEYSATRRNDKRMRTPSYADIDAIRIKYRMAAIMTKITGTVYHVDHHHPLSGVKISGLHIESNLKVITAHENHVKRNKFIPHFVKINCSFIKYKSGEKIYKLPA